MADLEPILNRISLNEQVVKQLLKKIRSDHKPGDRLSSEASLAKQFGISIITLRESLSVLAYRGLIERRHGSGTYVADPTASQWIAIYTNFDLSHPDLSYFHRRVPYHVKALLAEAGLRARIYTGPAPGNPPGEAIPSVPLSLIEDMELDTLRAVIALPPKGWKPFQNKGIPIIGTEPQAPLSVSLALNDFLTTALKTMFARGCRTAALLRWSNDPVEKQNWEDALAAFGMTTQPKWIAHGLDDPKEAPGWHVFRKLWHAYEEKPDCLIVTDDMLFREVSVAILYERIDVPSSLKVFTHFNKGSKIIIPFECSTFEVNPDSFAREIALLCQQQLVANSPKNRHIQVPIEIVECSLPN